jgi:hypothetical protein
LRDRAMLTMSATDLIPLSGFVTSTSGNSAVVPMKVKSSVGLYGNFLNAAAVAVNVAPKAVSV